MAKTKLLLADSSVFIRILLANGLSTLGFDVVAVAKDGQEALKMYARHSPDITLIDLGLDNGGGIDVIRALVKNHPLAVIAVMIPEKIDDPDVIVASVRAGARAYIKKPMSGKELKTRLTKLVRRGDGK
jgi:two-component system chemotaxis response regulator CheY